MLTTALHTGEGWQGSGLKDTRIWESELKSLPSLGQLEPKRIMTSVGEEVEKLEPSYTAGGIVKWYRRSGKQSGSSSKC